MREETYVPHTATELRYRGAVALERTAHWTAPWRLPPAEARLHLPEGGIGRAAMPAGVRVTFRTDSPYLRLAYQADPAPPLNGPQERPLLDVRVDEDLAHTAELTADGRDRAVRVALPGRGPRTVALWLPCYHQFRLRGITLAPGAHLAQDRSTGPRWLHYGSSVSQGRGASSPSAAWPAVVARRHGLDLTSLALGAGCCLQPVTATLLRDLPAELLTACVGINIQALGTHNAASLTAALVGFVRIVREGHPGTPFVLMSSIVAPDRETVPGPSGLTMPAVRECVREAVELLRAHGDAALHHLDGLAVLGPADTGLLLEPVGVDRLHPSPAGHARFADRFGAAVAAQLPPRVCVPLTA